MATFGATLLLLAFSLQTATSSRIKHPAAKLVESIDDEADPTSNVSDSMDAAQEQEQLEGSLAEINSTQGGPFDCNERERLDCSRKGTLRERQSCLFKCGDSITIDLEHMSGGEDETVSVWHGCEDSNPEFNNCSFYATSSGHECNMGRTPEGVRRRAWGRDAKDNCAKTCGYCKAPCVDKQTRESVKDPTRTCAYYRDHEEEFCKMGQRGTVRRRGYGGDAKDNCPLTCGYCEAKIVKKFKDMSISLGDSRRGDMFKHLGIDEISLERTSGFGSAFKDFEYIVKNNRAIKIILHDAEPHDYKKRCLLKWRHSAKFNSKKKPRLTGFTVQRLGRALR